MDDRRGHVALPHTADVILEAWGPDLATCFEEAVVALVEVGIEPTGAAAAERRHVELDPAPDDELLMALLDEVIFLLDTADGVPVGVHVRRRGDGGMAVEVLLADLATIEATGAVPKAVSRSELAVIHEDTGVRCRFLVDV